MLDYKIVIEGILETPEMHVMGFLKHIKLEAIKESSMQSAKKLNDLISQKLPNDVESNDVEPIKVEGSRMSIIKGASAEFTSFFIIQGIPVELSEGANYILNEKDGVWGIIPAHPSVLKVSLHGGYEHLAEAWQKTMSFIAKNKLAINQYANSWEVYTSEDKNNLVTEIYVPLILTANTDLDNIKL